MIKHLRPMTARTQTDGHRAATELELLFDLVFVVAIALAAVGLHHAVLEAHYLEGSIKYLLAFFALWWPWMHFTWFASAFDNDDVVYRSSVMAMMFGALLIAGGLPVFFESYDVRLMAVGYLVLRLPYLFLWFRAGQDNPDYKVAAQRYLWGQVLLQMCWMPMAFLVPFGSTLFFVAFVIGIVLELFVPYYAALDRQIPWHKGHIMERFGLLNIIVLGEVLLSAALAIQAMSKSGHWTIDLVILAICATIVPLVLWWLYFCEEENLIAEDTTHVFLWAYGHYFIYAAAAAAGAGFAALIDASGDHGHGDPNSARWLISIATAAYLFGLWLIRDRHILSKTAASTQLGFAALIALSPLLPNIMLPLLTVLLVLALVLRLKQQNAAAETPSAV